MKKFIILFSPLFFLASCGEQEVVSPEVITQNIPVAEDEVSEEAQGEDTNITEVVLKEPNAPSFTKTTINFEHSYNKKTALSFLGGTFLDIDSDGNNEIFITGGDNQGDKVFRYENGAVVDVTDTAGIQNTLASYGAYSLDIDTDGDDDLLVARQKGVYLYTNTSGTFTEKKLDIQLPQNAVPMDIDLADIDNDGDLDMYVSTFITAEFFKAATFNDPNNIQKNLLLQNNGDFSFTDITSSSGLDVSANTFTSTFADMDNDGDSDLVLSSNTDAVRVFENKGGVFSQAFVGDTYSFWMGLGLDDVDGDGDLDMFFSSIGTSIPRKLVQGDSNANQDVQVGYSFLENKGNFTFTERKDQAIDDLGFGWGITPVDFNLDERTDYMIMQNYIKWAPHKLSKLPGELLVQNTEGQLEAQIKAYGLTNKDYGISSLLGDINGDGLEDIIHLNLDGEPVLYIRDSDTNNRYLSVNIPNTPKYLQSTYTLTLANGDEIQETYLPKQGLLTKQDSTVVFGLNGNNSAMKTLEVTLADGTTEAIDLKVDQRRIDL